MSVAKYEQMFGDLKAQEQQFNDYWLALREGIQRFCNKVHTLMEYPSTSYIPRSGKAERWVSLAREPAGKELSAFEVVQEGGEGGYVKFYIRLILASTSEVSSYGEFYFGYKIRKIRNRIELVSLDRLDEIFYLDPDQGLEIAAKHLVNALQKEISETPASTWGA